MKYMLYISIALGASSPASAADWWKVSANGSGTTEKIFFMDRASMSSDRSGTMKVWDFSIHEKATDDGTRKTKALNRYDCNARTMTLLSLIKLGNNDRFISNHSWDSYEQSANHIVPDSVGEAKWQFACAGPQSDHYQVTIDPEVFAAKYFRIP